MCIRDRAHGVLVARLGVLLSAAVRTLDGVEIGERELGVDDFDVAERVDPARDCLLYTSPSPRDRTRSRMPSSA